MTDNVQPVYKRVLLKLSGEALQGTLSYGHDPAAIYQIADEIVSARELGVSLGLVVGGGNIFRGAQGAADGMDRSTGDSIGMLATVINALVLQDALERRGAPTRVMTAFEIRAVAEPYIRRRALRHLDKGRIVACAAGTGNPYFTTDTAAALRAAEIGADVLLKATKVEGVYDKDPLEHEDAVLFKHLTYMDMLSKDLKVMDAAAVSLCRDNGLPIIVFDLTQQGNVRDVMLGKDVGTAVGDTAP